MTREVHPFPPLIDEDCTVLILGSFPSVKSREQQFFYGHPQNRFWKVMAALLKEDVPVTIAAKRAMLLKHHIALWDVIQSCEIQGSSDSSITHVVPNDLARLCTSAPIQKIFCNGQTAYKYYVKYQEKTLGMKADVLPSSSPANARASLSDLIARWGEKMTGCI